MDETKREGRQAEKGSKSHLQNRTTCDDKYMTTEEFEQMVNKKMENDKKGILN